MSLIEAFFTQTATVKPFIRQGAGEAVYGTVATRSCRIELGAHMMTTFKHPDGQIDQVEARARMFCVGDKIPNDSIVTYDGVDYTVLDCKIKRGFGFSHLEVYLM